MKKMKTRFIAVALAFCLVCSSQPTSTSNVSAKTKKVYITRTGYKYHTHKCGRGTYFKVTLKKAKRMGLKKCKKCY